MTSTEVLLAAGLGLLLGLYTLLYHNYLRGTWCTNHISLRGKTAIITGANVGIGKETALDLARQGARVVLACRDKVRGEAAAHDIRRESGNNEVLFMRLDLASLKSVCAFAETNLQSEPRLDLLIKNAGTVTDGTSEDGFNMTFQVNHLGHFLLTYLLLDRLKRCAPSRVVLVSSILYGLGKINSDTIYKPVTRVLPGYLSYCNSKLANILHARELAHRLDGTNVTCYSLHPGFVNSEIVCYMPIWVKLFFFPIKWLFFQDSTAGAQTSIHCATQEGIEQFSGSYFANCRVEELRRVACLGGAPYKICLGALRKGKDLFCLRTLGAPVARGPRIIDTADTAVATPLQELLPCARDDAAAKKLWELSERLLGLAS